MSQQPSSHHQLDIESSESPVPFDISSDDNSDSSDALALIEVKTRAIVVDDSESENGDWPIRPVIVVRPPTEEGSEIIVRGISEELRGADESEIFDERQLDADDNDSDEIPLADLRKRRKAKQKREEAPRSQALRQSPPPGPPQVSVTVTEPPIIVIPDDPEPMAPDTPAVPTATPRPRPVTTIVLPPP